MATKLNPLQNFNSKREYNILMSEGGEPVARNHSIEVLIQHWSTPNYSNYEYFYAMHDIVDKILDLKAGESMYFQPNRDDKTSKGIITRTK